MNNGPHTANFRDKSYQSAGKNTAALLKFNFNKFINRVSKCDRKSLVNLKSNLRKYYLIISFKF
ncbi:MAG: hypothetical protein CVV24_07375 [Ignavibacteriae bacterium HGW-Ignavibacteriae-3]|nr:MAG: hypothetical protein CVV24_07375 [Ignavibacteriae bacterium HGW-Ignavibacteriae-3]